MSVIAELSLFPIGHGESVSGPVSKALDVVAKSGLPYTLGPMGTCIEGDYDAVMGVVRECYLALEADHERIYMALKIDARAKRTDGLRGKVATAESQMGKAGT
jgi:uncharacterized protein (TIGR00106 family)